MVEKERRDQEARAKDLQVQLDDAETNAIKWGRKMVAKLESRCRELEAELDSEQRRCGDAHKNFRKSERMIKEYSFKADEDRKNAERMQDLVDKLQQQARATMIARLLSLNPEFNKMPIFFLVRYATTRSR